MLFLLGIFMLLLSRHIPHLMAENDPSATVNIVTLTVVFFLLNFLAATQDIAVDGWALTMLSRYVRKHVTKSHNVQVVMCVLCCCVVTGLVILHMNCVSDAT